MLLAGAQYRSFHVTGSSEIIFLSSQHSGDLEKAFLRFSIIRPRCYRLTETPIWTSASAIRRSSAACLSGTHGE